MSQFSGALYSLRVHPHIPSSVWDCSWQLKVAIIVLQDLKNHSLGDQSVHHSMGCCWIRGSPHCPNTRGVWYTDWVDSSTSDLLLTSLRSTFSKGSSLICISLFSVFFAFQNISTTRKKFRYSFLISIYGKSRKIAKAKRIFGDNFASIILVNIAIKIIFGFQTKPNEFC